MRNKCDNVGESHVKQKNSRGAVVCQAIHLPWAILPSACPLVLMNLGLVLWSFFEPG